MTAIPPKGSPAAKARRQPQIDLSGLTDAQRTVRERVILIGMAAYGDRWRTDLAAAIAERLGRPYSTTQVMGWVQGRRPVPQAIEALIPGLVLDLAADLEKRAAILRDLK